MSIMKWRVSLLLGFVLAFAQTGAAYQFVESITPDGETVLLKWGPDNIPVVYHVNNSQPGDMSLDAAVTAIQTSFDTWQSIESASITFQYGGLTSAEPFVFFDFISTLGFLTDPELEGSGILGATNWVFFTQTGEIAESDIFFNDFFHWSVSPNGTPGRYDFQSTVTHEIGHFLGLGHSNTMVMETTGLRRTVVEGSAMMNPFAYPAGNIIGRIPLADDIAGVSVIYPDRGFNAATGTISGEVTKNGQAVFGAYVDAYNPFTDELIGIFTDRDGNYSLAGLKAGPHIVRVHPIKDPVSPEDFGFPERLIDMDFKDEFYLERAEVLIGGTTSGIDFEVQQ